MKQIVNRIPEVFFGCLAAYWIFDNYANGHINYFAVVALLIIIVQIIFQKRIIGLVAGIVLGVFSSYMILAVLTDYNKSGGKAMEYLLTAGGIFAVGVIMAATMIYKFAVLEVNRTENAITAAS